MAGSVWAGGPLDEDEVVEETEETEETETDEE